LQNYKTEKSKIIKNQLGILVYDGIKDKYSFPSSGFVFAVLLKLL
jgi:hypothetical protein